MKGYIHGEAAILIFKILTIQAKKMESRNYLVDPFTTHIRNTTQFGEEDQMAGWILHAFESAALRNMSLYFS
jgi:hypothetical protein